MKMTRQAQWRGILKLILPGVIVGLINSVFSAFVMHPLIGEVSRDEVVVSTYAINVFVGWVFFSAWFLARADEEWKRVAEAVIRHDRDVFMIEAPKRIATSVRVLYLLISLLVILSFHLFHIQSALVLFELQFGIAFLVVVTILVLWDLDDPVRGVINVPNIPQEWLSELATHESLNNGQSIAG
jgi:hypothetical protein